MINSPMKTSTYYNAKFASLLPVFSNSNMKKGEGGKVGVIGGSFEFVGAPYFSSMAALRAVS